MNDRGKDSARKVVFLTLGCKANRYDSSAMMAMARGPGFEVADDSLSGQGEIFADVYVINTCAVTGKSAFQSRQLVRRARRWNPDATVIATGCLADIDPASLEQAGADLVRGTGERERVIEHLLGKPVPAGPVFHHPEGGIQERGRAVVKIQDGCDRACAYCVVRIARGKSRSLAPEEALGQIAALAARGRREIVLTGIHLGLYGKDRGDSLESLLQKAAALPGDFRLRLSSLEPQDLADSLIELIASSPRFCPHFHLPLQSGDANVLRRMGRPYTPEAFAGRVAAIKSAMPDAGIGVDLIAGFPGETPEAHARGIELLRGLPLGYFHVFPFSIRPGTRAAEMDGQVGPPEIKRRAAELRKLGVEKKRSFLKSQVGRVLEVLAETADPAGGRASREGGGWWAGSSGNYVRVVFQASGVEAGEVVPVKISRAGQASAEGARHSAYTRE